MPRKIRSTFFGLVTLCLGRIRQEEGDEIFVEEDRNVYRRLIMKDGVPEGILFQGDIAHSGIWQYMIKSKIDISSMKIRFLRLRLLILRNRRSWEICVEK